jgi:hypothetical protein
MMKRLKCVEVQCPTSMFTEGKVYNGFDYNNYIDRLQTVKDDLGHSRHICVSNETIRFIIGWKPSTEFVWPFIPQYAVFELEEIGTTKKD